MEPVVAAGAAGAVAGGEAMAGSVEGTVAGGGLRGKGGGQENERSVKQALGWAGHDGASGRDDDGKASPSKVDRERRGGQGVKKT